MGLRTRQVALVVVALPAILVSLAAQQSNTQQPQQPTFRTGVRLVRVDVTVTGRDDQPAAGLQAADFEVSEDGVSQRVDQVHFVRRDGRPPAGDDRSLDIRSQEQAEAEAARDDVRVFGLFLDDYHVDKAPGVMIPLRRSLARFVERLWPTDLVAMMDPLTPLSALRFTRSRDELLETINGFQGRQGEIFPVRSPIEEAQLTSNDLARVRAEVTLSALASLVMRLGAMGEGRKVLIFVSQGPPVFFYRDGSLQDRMREISQAASRGNVTIYPLDPRGVGAMTRGSRDTLLQLAAESGGRAITNTNDAAVGLSRLLRDFSAYYVLGYQPTRGEDDGKYHKISVKVKRSGMHVLARQGYWAPSARELEAARAAAARSVDPGVARAMDGLAGQGERRAADVWVGFARADGGATRVSVTWDESPGRLSRAARVVALEVEALDGRNGSVMQPVQAIPVDAAGGAPSVAAFLLKPGDRALRLTARSDAASVVDRWVLPIAVPDFGARPVSLSTPRVYRARSLAELKAINAARDPRPSAVRRFARTDRVVVALDCYAPMPRTGASGPSDSRTDRPEVEAHLLSKDGRELAPLPLPAGDGANVRFELPLSSLGQGTYLVRVRVRSRGSAAEQHLAFTIAA